MIALLAVLLAQGASIDGLRILDEGVSKGYVTEVNCTGASFACSVSGRRATFNVTGGGGATPGGVSGNLQTNNGLGGFGAYLGASCPYALQALDASGAATCRAAPTIPPDVSTEAIVTIGASVPLTNEKVVPTCTGNDKLTYNGGANLVCATDQTGGGGGGTSVQGTLDFGASNTSTSVVIATGSITGTSKPVCGLDSITGTADHPASSDDAALDQLSVTPTAISAGVSLTVLAAAPNGTWGQFLVNCVF